MYDFHYNFVKRLYGEKAKLLFTDTDSLCYHIKTKDISADCIHHKDIFDFCDYPEESEEYKKRVVSNKKKVGKFKDENNGLEMEEFCGLRSKMYAYRPKIDKNDYSNRKKEGKLCKGIQFCVSSRFKFDNYKNCLMGETQFPVKTMGIRSYEHELYTIQQKKIAISRYDDKRYILPDGIETLAYGHYKILEEWG